MKKIIVYSVIIVFAIIAIINFALYQNIKNEKPSKYVCHKNKLLIQIEDDARVYLHKRHFSCKVIDNVLIILEE